MKSQRRYGLPTAMTMVVGIVIGSGIFFKSDAILRDTGGNILLGCALFLIAALSIVFGGLTLAQLAARTDDPGGITAYAGEFVGEKFGSAMGWFQTFVYLPSLVSVVSYASGMYICQLFGWSFGSSAVSIGVWCAIGGVMTLLFFLMNILSAKLGGYFQNCATVLKLVPLFVLAVAGLIWGDPAKVLTQSAAHLSAPVNWLAGIGAVAFAFDGWVVSTSICHELKNSKRNLPFALTFCPIFILIVYIAYFVGLSSLVPPSDIDPATPQVYQAARALFGGFGAKLVLIFVVISMLGTLNGMVLGSIRLPHSLAVSGRLPQGYAGWNSRFDMPLRSALLALATTLLWIALHFITQEFGLIGGSDVSEAAILLNYVLLCVLYFKVIKLEGRQHPVKGVVIPLLAVAGALVIFFGALGKPILLLYEGVYAVVLYAGYRFANRRTAESSR